MSRRPFPKINRTSMALQRLAFVFHFLWASYEKKVTRRAILHKSSMLFGLPSLSKKQGKTLHSGKLS